MYLILMHWKLLDKLKLINIYKQLTVACFGDSYHLILKKRVQVLLNSLLDLMLYIKIGYSIVSNVHNKKILTLLSCFYPEI
jgi:hypothetical protein